MIHIAPCCIIIAHAFGRVGCAFAGCCYGKEITSGIAMYNHGAWRIPTQLYEAFFLFVLYAVLFYLVKRKNFKYTMPIYLFVYGIFRFIIEFFRADERGTLVGAISPSQFWSIAMVVLSVVIFFILKWAFDKAEKEDKLKNEKV
jgi:phosphatidylglycerol:prolipoprotein diacylglycerol transferase